MLCRSGIAVAVQGRWRDSFLSMSRGPATLLMAGSLMMLSRPVATGKNFRVAYVSGWAGLANARARVGAEELIPYSDHGDFGELVQMIERSGASRVDLVHGYTEPFARILRQRGIQAYAAGALSEPEDDGRQE